MTELNMKKIIISFLFLFTPIIYSFFISGCGEDTTSAGNQTDEEYLVGLLTQGIFSSNQGEDNLMYNETIDLDDGFAIADDSSDTKIDSLYKWGRIVNNVSISYNITNEGDTLKDINVARTITGNFVIVGKINGIVDTIVKPYTQVINRYVVFKRTGYYAWPRFNWRLYKISIADGQTTAPQIGSDYVRMNKIEIYRNNELTYTFNGPDFSQQVFTSKKYDGQLPTAYIGDTIKIKVYEFSNQPDKDIVAWHWAKNVSGFHRVPFGLISETPSGNGWDRIYEKTFKIYGSHSSGIFNGFISASTNKSLFDDNLGEFASDLVGIPYSIGQ